MNVQERDLRILEHILTYCDQIEMAVERFGRSFDLFDSDPVYRNSVAADQTYAEYRGPSVWNGG